MRRATNEWGWPVGALILLALSAFSLACRLAPNPELGLSSGQSLIEQLLGASRVALGQNFYRMADLYFHMGVSEEREDAAIDDPFQRIRAEIAPALHRHAKGVGIYELMPWLRFATDLDPHNVEAYSVAAYWLSRQGGRSDLAEAVLNEAARNNPRDYRVYAEKGRLFMYRKEAGQAAMAFDAGLRVWPGGSSADDPQARLDLANMLVSRAFLFELAGRNEWARPLIVRALALVPEDRALAEHLRRLDDGQISAETSRRVWERPHEEHDDEAQCHRVHQHDDSCGHHH